MALKAVLESIDDLDEVLKAEYTEKDGKFYLDVADVDSHPKVVALKNAHERQKQENTTLKAQVTTLETKFKDVPDDFSVDEYNRLLALADIDPNDPDAKKKLKNATDERLTQLRTNYEQQIANLKAKYDKDMAEKDVVVTTERGLRARDKAEVELAKAMDESFIDPKFKDAVRALHSAGVKHAVDDDGNVRVYFETDLGEVSPTDYLKSWSETERGKPFVAIPVGVKGNGGGSDRAIANNPFTAQFWNKTEQARLRNDPQKAERYARAAGFADVNKGLAATHAVDAK
jgi:hypothetical protein